MRRTDVVDKISKTIRRVEPSATAILYGSEARGDARPDSDIDVLILLDGEQRDLEREHNISGKLYEIELASGIL
ncbi:MAG: nucleotidyltransferase domain-containing protein, partial [Bacteroidaceae bacterium]|nr:nucleotidyltransferase domain-containing protein [Bacteroidaceae bacterium]